MANRQGDSTNYVPHMQFCEHAATGIIDAWIHDRNDYNTSSKRLGLLMQFTIEATGIIDAWIHDRNGYNTSSKRLGLLMQFTIEMIKTRAQSEGM